MKKISIPDESYWKMVELKVRLRCRTWRELIDKLYKLVEYSMGGKRGNVKG